MLPPGLAKLATSPKATGSATPAMTIGIVLVAACDARAAGVPKATMTVGLGLDDLVCERRKSLVAAAAEMPRHCEIPALHVAELAHPRQPGGEIVVLE
jgi:hypothetical protein